MKIYAQRARHHHHRLLSLLAHWRWWVALILIIIFGTSFFLAGAYAHSKDFFALVVRPALAENVRIPFNYVQGLFSNPTHLSISLKHEDFQKLAYKRSEALERGILIAEDDDWVNATISQAGQAYKADIRLKGDWIDHLAGRKWSFRVKLDDGALMGMKRFSLHHPKARNFLYEWVYQQALRREDILSLRYTFVTVDVNGRYLGVYALEEHFSKELLESQSRREGPILRFNENLLWADRVASNLGSVNESPTGLQDPEASLVDAFRVNSLLSNPVLSRDFLLAQDLLNMYRRGERHLGEVFDVERLARFFALSKVLGAEHATQWHNLRFYYNPITSLLEPIGFDGDAGKNIGDVAMPELFPETEFQEAYLGALEEFSESSYMDQLLADIAPELARERRRLYRSYPYMHFTEDVFYENQRTLRAALNPAQGIRAHLVELGRDEVALDIGTTQYLPVRVLGLQIGDELLKPYGKDINMPGRKEGALPEFKRLRFLLPLSLRGDKAVLDGAHVLYGVLGTSVTREAGILPWIGVSDPERSNPAIRAATIRAFSFLSIDNSLKEVTVRPGVWAVERDLVIPAGYSFIVAAGAELNLARQAMILSYGPVRFLGTEAMPVVVRSHDGGGQGMVVMRAREESLLRYARFEGLAPPMRDGWELTGAVTFYESPVTIERSYFAENSAGDDMLNIVRSTFSITDSVFNKALSDAFDGDFVTGTISGTSFLRSGGDAIDVSGSVITVEGITIDGVGDKGVSIGEASEATLTDINITNALVGIASKDGSKVTARDLLISETTTGLAAYQKKLEYGPSSLSVMGLELKSVETPMFVETKSVVVVDGEKAPEQEEGWYEELYGEL
ncbi:MAG: hypothetical protein COV10_02015 [Candidatus Vogelbacteria bacterium CG10_big_fil_rev_8_21_14_0_10_51_16]|uniref:Right handed beta helix domain-containing protein n=1 Tax=Candidatus Vogelbacteria bacterium CG10_big_fil_rev_8_21_14_0_10_51_16 TaxID=1975045 RepID=A0A2H0REI0_9BACT|nr:MAG: hypothetical protein COV10_02015 [Candidatus Vogelbacteria bacterium CG10_big_fil_rev_8_21_14_0_10_51_16]